MFEQYFCRSDDGTDYPFLGCHAAGIAHDGREVVLSYAQMVGVEGERAFVAAMQVEQTDKAVEDVCVAHRRDR